MSIFVNLFAQFIRPPEKEWEQQAIHLIRNADMSNIVVSDNGAVSRINDTLTKDEVVYYQSVADEVIQAETLSFSNEDYERAIN